jgi:hypothetical protein
LHSLGYRIDEPFERVGLVTNYVGNKQQPQTEDSMVG